MTLDHLDTLEYKTTVQPLREAGISRTVTLSAKQLHSKLCHTTLILCPNSNTNVNDYQFVISNIILQFKFASFLIQLFV
jgi:hypothetical protein